MAIISYEGCGQSTVLRAAGDHTFLSCGQSTVISAVDNQQSLNNIDFDLLWKNLSLKHGKSIFILLEKKQKVLKKTVGVISRYPSFKELLTKKTL